MPTDLERLKDTFDRIGVANRLEHGQVLVDFDVMKGVETMNHIIMDKDTAIFYFDGEGVFLGFKPGKTETGPGSGPGSGPPKWETGPGSGLDTTGERNVTVPRIPQASSVNTGGVGTLHPSIDGTGGSVTGTDQSMHQKQHGEATELVAGLQSAGATVHEAQVTRIASGNPMINPKSEQVQDTIPVINPLHILWGKAKDYPDYLKQQWVDLQAYIEHLRAVPNNMFGMLIMFINHQRDLLNKLEEDMRKELT